MTDKTTKQSTPDETLNISTAVIETLTPEQEEILSIDLQQEIANQSVTPTDATEQPSSTDEETQQESNIENEATTQPTQTPEEDSGESMDEAVGTSLVNAAEAATTEAPAEENPTPEEEPTVEETPATAEVPVAEDQASNTDDVIVNTSAADIEAEEALAPQFTIPPGAAITAMEDGSGFSVVTDDDNFEIKPIVLPTEGISISEINKMNNDEISSELDRILKKVSDIHKLPFEQIKQYLTAMAPSQMVDIDVGKRQQISLFHAIKQIFNNPDVEDQFQIHMTALLRVFELAKDGALSDSHVFRFTEYVEMKKDDLIAFTRWINLLKVTSDPKSRATSLKQVDFNKALQYGLTDSARRRILNYYGI